MELTKEQFESLINYLDSVSSACTDVIIRNGRIRQLSDDRTIIYDIDTGLDKLNANLQLVKSYVNIFKVFIPDEDDQTIRLDSNLEKNILILDDGESEIRFTMGDERYLNAQFIEDTRISNIIKQALYNFPISPRVIKKINTLAKDFSTEALNIIANDSSLSLTITSASKTKKANIIKVKNEGNVLENGEYVVSVNLFSYKFNNPVLEIYEVDIKSSDRAMIIKEDNVRIIAIIQKKD